MVKLVILVGPPCSGKSTYAKSKESEGFVHISQDAMGRTEHMRYFSLALMEDKNIILDRMNFNRFQRSKYIDKAREFGYSIHVVEFLIPYEIRSIRAEKRLNHETIGNFVTFRSVSSFFDRDYEKPEPDEYDTYEVIKWKVDMLELNLLNSTTN